MNIGCPPLVIVMRQVWFGPDWINLYQSASFPTVLMIGFLCVIPDPPIDGQGSWSDRDDPTPLNL